jgi:hypothetical protein
MLLIERTNQLGNTFGLVRAPRINGAGECIRLEVEPEEWPDRLNTGTLVAPYLLIL